jgi:hypothetical protein
MMSQNPVFTDNTTITGDGTEEHPLTGASSSGPGGNSGDVQLNVSGAFGNVEEQAPASDTQFTVDNSGNFVFQTNGNILFDIEGNWEVVTSAGSMNFISNAPGRGVVIEANGGGGLGFIAAGGGAELNDTSGTGLIQIARTLGNTLQLGNGSGPLGFFGTAGVTQPSVTGSRAAGAALVSLLTQLANLGLIVDNTTP